MIIIMGPIEIMGKPFIGNKLFIKVICPESEFMDYDTLNVLKG